MEQVKVALDAAHMDGTPFPHTLAVGHQGTGKTQLAHVIADEMATAFIEVLGQNLSNAAQLNQFLLSATGQVRIHQNESLSDPTGIPSAGFAGHPHAAGRYEAVSDTNTSRRPLPIHQERRLNRVVLHFPYGSSLKPIQARDVAIVTRCGRPVSSAW
jgi:hypothetical protein